MNDDTSPSDDLRRAAQKHRSRAILAVLFVLVAVFYAVAMVRIGEQGEARRAAATAPR
ncbi:hypothetical protein [Falsiroseomonas tokyonensis]|uniref:Uncharacterized protein n=1 Tax=Falsiroseomonas tokyonensis TaxID=430521 RepID=A0ABV7C2P3_9PROT|nr:hypothetical protein [Falsiroseomonas tokyonensis]MBU8542023.1 hypothetical protein [Falsiroseomonas tokyonensis]